jgi:HlyD family secretion protein
MKKRLIIAGSIAVSGIIVMLFIRFGGSGDRDALVLSGNIEVVEVNVGFKVAGRVRSLYTDEGKSVALEDRLAEIDSAEFSSVVSQNRASVQNAQAEFNKAQKDLDRFARLYQEGAISSQQMDSAKTTYEVAVSRLDLSKASLKTAEVRLRDMMVFSPIAGVVLRKNVEAGETVSAGTPVFTIGDLENPWVKVYVKEDKLGLVKRGQKAEVMVDSYPKKIYDGTVTSIASEAEFTPKNVQTREERVKLVYGVKVSVKNQDQELKPGMPADVKILLK